MTAGFILYEQDGGIVTLTMNNPATMNALSGEPETRSMEEACRRIDADLSVRCVILTGAGHAFCSGGHVKDLLAKQGLGEGSAHDIQNRYRNSVQRMALALYRLQVPAIAAVNGPAYGAGCDIATMCDMRIASTRATFAESFVKLGLVAGDGGSWLLPRAIGMSRAAEMTFTAEPIDALTAREWGLVSRVVEPDRLMEEARALAGRIAVHPGTALRMSKRLLREGQRTGLETLLEMTAAYQAIAHHTVEHDEAMHQHFGRKA
jgi:enoyl-CoA hydratase/carnithine racemase